MKKNYFYAVTEIYGIFATQADNEAINKMNWIINCLNAKIMKQDKYVNWVEFIRQTIPLQELPKGYDFGMGVLIYGYVIPISRESG